MDRCPNCRARLDGAETCRRCGMELGLLRATERAADAWLRRAIAHLTRDEFECARQALHRALALRRDPLAESLRGLLHRTSSAVFEPLTASATAAASPDDGAEPETETLADHVARIPGRGLRAFYSRLFHRR
ncbi:hypothetical protein [Halochromatium salexigens]|uniref:Uncharacterized protein n=1 Tax=Halochromatium salexigens TaxID=49447 RepID=A0AAJ0UFY3_HALSE|nr:hypothetical protein [Halochromatium salexigens]MBK5930731.1 hypothetical protein [Halochromatium salexigens]